MELNRYNETSRLVFVCMRCSRDVVQNSCVLSLHRNEVVAKQWRSDVAYWTIMFQRVLFASIEIQSTQNNQWNETQKASIEDLPILNNLSESIVEISSIARNAKTSSADLESDIYKEMCRVPYMVNFQLREVITSFRLLGFSDPPFHINEELQIIRLSRIIIDAYSDLRKLIDTPHPYPIIQIARTFLYLWLFSLPFALANDEDFHVVSVMIVFFITYGFVGLEYVYMDMVDPFSVNLIDFDIKSFSESVVEDIYITLSDIDGTESASKLHQRVQDKEQTNMAMAKVNNSILTHYRSLQKVSTMRASHPNITYDEATEKTRLLEQMSAP